MTIQYLIYVNGVEAALTRQFGCTCNRCRDQRTTAHTSVSIIGIDSQGDTQQHILIDVGLGVSDSLLNSPYLIGDQARLDWLLLTHWHPDHTLSLNWLASSWWQTQRRRNQAPGQQPKTVPVWCRVGTAKWMARRHDFEWHRTLKPVLSDETCSAGNVLPSVPLGLEALTITPITVKHFNADVDADNPKRTLPCCASFVAQTPNKKAVFLWDVDIRNTWLLEPSTVEQKATVALLAEADYLFIDCTTWATEKMNGHKIHHLSFSFVQKVAAILSPKETFLVHLSGHPDGEGNPGYGWSDQTWTIEAQKVWAERSLPGSVSVPKIGDIRYL
ncbi:MAG: MBL fold metallo-hydrolase [Chloroflexota bacterium]